ncbi:hypothetical protein PUN28_012016 [Cardiocondyla obscurior]|uniref:Uncharacterized protein n=1 Tax=Cardiocondyla obscurior TaxID=286306 RepID=A0AAW2FA62_9HYME
MGYTTLPSRSPAAPGTTRAGQAPIKRAASRRAFCAGLSRRPQPPIVRPSCRPGRDEAATDNNYSSNTRHTWGRRKNSQRVKAACKTEARSILKPRIRRPLT